MSDDKKITLLSHKRFAEDLLGLNRPMFVNTQVSLEEVESFSSSVVEGEDWKGEEYLWICLDSVLGIFDGEKYAEIDMGLLKSFKDTDKAIKGLEKTKRELRLLEAQLAQFITKTREGIQMLEDKLKESP